MSKIIDYCALRIKNHSYETKWDHDEKQRIVEKAEQEKKIKDHIAKGWVPFGSLGVINDYNVFQAWVKYDTDSIKEALDKLAKAEEEKNEAQENVAEAMEKVHIAEKMLTTTVNELDMWKKRALTAEVALNESYETKEIWKQRALKAEEDYKFCLEQSIKKE
jgi:hypothetical protein